MPRDFAYALDVDPFVLESAARHFDTTYHLHFGFLEKYDSYFFRVDRSETVSRDPVAVAWRDLSAQLRDGGRPRVRVRDLDEAGVDRLSQMLAQSYRRAEADGSAREAAEALKGLSEAFDGFTGLARMTPAQRSAAASEPALARWRAQLAAEEREAAARRREEVRRLEQEPVMRGVLDAGPVRDGFAEFFPGQVSEDT